MEALGNGGFFIEFYLNLSSIDDLDFFLDIIMNY